MLHVVTQFVIERESQIPRHLNIEWWTTNWAAFISRPKFEPSVGSGLDLRKTHHFAEKILLEKGTDAARCEAPHTVVSLSSCVINNSKYFESLQPFMVVGTVGRSRILVRGWGQRSFDTMGVWAQNLLKIGFFPLKLKSWGLGGRAPWAPWIRQWVGHFPSCPF